MANTYRTVNLSAGAGVDDKKLKVSIDDKQHEFLEQKVGAASPKVIVTVEDPGLIERLIIDVDETEIDHNSLLNYDVNEHRPVNDLATANDSLWSSQKVQEELNLKVTAVSSTDNAVTRFDGTEGQIKNSGVIIDDSDNITIPGNLTVQGTLTYIDTDILEVADANITVNKNGTQSTANTQQSGIRIEMTDATDVILGYDSSLASKMSVGEIGDESEIITSTHTQSLFNKTIEYDPTGTNISEDNVQGAITQLDSFIVSLGDDKANITLDNLQPNLATGQYNFPSDITFAKGVGTPVVIRGKELIFGEASGPLTIFSGSTRNESSGGLSIISGNVFGDQLFSSGNYWSGSGQIVDPLNSGDSGYAALSSGRVQGGRSGDVYVFSGSTVNGGSRGNVFITGNDVVINDTNDNTIAIMSEFGIDLRYDINMNNQRITFLADPIDNQDAATKSYVDNSKSSIITTDGLQGGGSLQNDLLISLAVQELDEQTEIDNLSDFMVMYDASVDEHKKIKIGDVLGLGSSNGDISESSDQILESQTDTIVSGLAFNSLEVRSFSALISINIDATTDVFEQVRIEGINKGTSWEISQSSVGDDSFIDFNIDNNGQITYSSGAYTGFVSGNISYRAITTSIV